MHTVMSGLHTLMSGMHTVTGGMHTVMTGMHTARWHARTLQRVVFVFIYSSLKF